jgi:copper chaperone
MYASFYFDAASGATIVLFAAALFSLVMFVNYLKERIQAPSASITFQKEVPLEHEHPHRHEGVVHLHEHEDVTAHDHHTGGEARQRVTLTVTGMTCGHCVQSVERWIGALDGVEDVRVDLPTRQAAIAYRPAQVTVDGIKRTIVEAGYGVE